MSASADRSVGRRDYGWACALGLVIVTGLGLTHRGSLLTPSRNNHFTHLALGWLDGRMHLTGPPPGYCLPADRQARRCTASTADDWGRVDTLTLASGEVLRAFPCRASFCQAKEPGTQAFWVLGAGWREIARRSITDVSPTWYVTFPPAPAMLLLPFVYFFGLSTPDVLLTLLGQALTCAIFYLTLRRLALSPRIATWAVLAWALASPAAEVAAQGGVWFTGQLVGALGVALVLFGGLGVGQPLLAGLGWAIALGSRPSSAMALGVLLLVESRRAQAPWRKYVAWLFLPALCLLGMAWVNWLRFGDVFEFGHRFLETRWQARIQTHGLFALEYLGRNLQCLLTLMPSLAANFPFMRVSIHGAALWLTSPWLLIWPRWRAIDRRGRLLLATVALAGLPALFYQNSGQTQFSYRFAIDWILLVLTAQACAGMVSTHRFRVLVIVGLVVHVSAAWAWQHVPSRLFVGDPLGWPFETELMER